METEFKFMPNVKRDLLQYTGIRNYIESAEIGLIPKHALLDYILEDLQSKKCFISYVLLINLIVLNSGKINLFSGTFNPDCRSTDLVYNFIKNIILC